MIFILFLIIVPQKHFLFNKIPTFLVEKQFSHQIFVAAFEKMCFLPGSGFVLKSNSDQYLEKKTWIRIPKNACGSLTLFVCSTDNLHTALHICTGYGLHTVLHICIGYGLLCPVHEVHVPGLGSWWDEQEAGPDRLHTGA